MFIALGLLRERFYTSPPGRPAHSDNNSTSQGSIQPCFHSHTLMYFPNNSSILNQLSIVFIMSKCPTSNCTVTYTASFVITASMLQYFAQYGEVVDCVVMKNQQTGKSRGFGFVTFKDPACLDLVLSSGPHTLDGRQVRAEEVRNLVKFVYSIVHCLCIS